MFKSRSDKKAPGRFELPISCLLDRRFNQLSHGATAIERPELSCLVQLQKTTRRIVKDTNMCFNNPKFESKYIEGQSGWLVMREEEREEKKMVAQRGARTHDPEIKSLMLYRLS